MGEDFKERAVHNINKKRFDENFEKIFGKKLKHIHRFYEVKDFTNEEYERHNVIAVSVIDLGRKICKLCGHIEPEDKLWVV